MNSTLFHRPPNHNATARIEQRTSAVADPHVLTRKAVERWENEGGKIPELALRKEKDRVPSRKRC